MNEIKFIMLSRLLEDLQKYYDEFGDIPVMIASTQAKDPMTPVQGSMVIEISHKEDTSHTEQCVVISDFPIDIDDLESSTTSE